MFSSNEETKKLYPFEFNFYMKYILDGRKLRLEYRVENLGNEDNFVEFVFSSNEETKKLYPFEFNFYMKYILDGRKLRLEYRVENLGNEDMYFSLGAHPAFAAPLKDGMDFSDYYIEFEKNEDGNAKVLNGALIAAGKEENIFSGNIMKLSKYRFINDAIIFENTNSKTAYLKNTKDKRVLGFNYDGFRYIAFWNVPGADRFINDAIIFENTNSKTAYLKNTKDKRVLGFNYDGFRYIAFWNVPGAEYVCFEPWNGISDYDNCSGKLEEKTGIEKISGKEIYTRAIEITVFEV